MRSEFSALLRRNEPANGSKPIERRRARDLPFDQAAVRRGQPVILDTTVYIDQLQGRLPPELEGVLGRALILHASVARAEIAISIGLLDPADPRSDSRRTVLVALLDRMRLDRRVTPSDKAWTEAAVLAGILARTLKLDARERRSLLNDALLLMTARENGATLLSRNIADMDRLTALRPDAKVLLYERS